MTMPATCCFLFFRWYIKLSQLVYDITVRQGFRVITVEISRISRKAMSLVNFFLLTAIIALAPSCYSRVASPSHGHCMFGPFRDTALTCIKQHRGFTGCVMQDFEWFFPNHTLSIHRILKSSKVYVKRPGHWRTLRKAMRACVADANEYGTNREERSEGFIACLNDKNAFTELFPRIFCGRKSNRQMDRKVPQSSNELLQDMPHCGFNKTSGTFVSCSRNSSEIDKSHTQIIATCALGPLKRNLMNCLSTLYKINGCFLNGLDYFTESDKIIPTQVINSVQPYVIYSEYRERINANIKTCVEKANSVIGRSDVSDTFVNCWLNGTHLTLFEQGLCPKDNSTEEYSPANLSTNGVEPNYTKALVILAYDTLEKFFQVLVS
ncbi:uncharacterized protein LOC135167034 [Diachasmimorpha longicaudata]|uniref:uncharacterized protein LOC135167034 n=1 Tax=Diachasmimorpha longicaudata TaxID=58733 RepID=UPI0030B9102B